MTSTQVTHLQVPLFEGLTYKDIMEHVMNIPDAMLRLPEASEIQRLPRQYLINVVATVVGE